MLIDGFEELRISNSKRFIQENKNRIRLEQPRKNLYKPYLLFPFQNNQQSTLTAILPFHIWNQKNQPS